MTRDYDPVLIHRATCPEAPQGLLLLTARSVAQAHPHGRPHRCLTNEMARSNCGVVIEQVTPEPHDYVESTIVPADATRPLCRICRGTHGEAPPQPETPAPLSALIVPGR